MLVVKARAHYLSMFLALLALGVGFLAPPTQAQQAPPSGIPDASCPPPAVLYLGGVPTFAETFTAINTGRLTSAQVEILKLAGAEDVTFSIQAVDPVTGAPSGVDLATTIVPGASIPVGFSTVTANFANPAFVVSGQQYALVVTSPGIAAVNLGPGFREDNPSCPGQAYASFAGPGGPFDTVVVGGVAFDLVFTVFVTPEEQPQPQQPVCPPVSQELGQEAQSGGVDLSGGVENSGDYAGQTAAPLQFGDSGDLQNGTGVLQACGSELDDVESGGIYKEISPTLDTASDRTIGQSSGGPE